MSESVGRLKVGRLKSRTLEDAESKGWKMRRRRFRLLSIFLLLGVLSTQGTEADGNVHVLWTYVSDGKLYTSPVVADIDGDGFPEILMAESDAGRMTCLDRGGAVVWQYTVGPIHASPCVVDLDRDGTLETVFGDTTGLVTCVCSEGDLIWERQSDSALDWTALTAGDMNGDGVPEIVFQGANGIVKCLDAWGRPSWEFPAGTDGSTSPASIPVHGSKRVDVVVASPDGVIHRLDWRGKSVWTYDTGAEATCSVVTGDADGDGSFEVWLPASDGVIHCLEGNTGNLIWRCPQVNVQDETLSLGDLDADGKLELVCGTAEGELVAISPEGQVMWRTDCKGPARDSGVWIDKPASLGDVDRDGEIECLVGGRSWKVHCLGPEGDLEWIYEADNAVLSTPALVDLDGNGFLEILVASKDRKLVCLRVDGMETRLQPSVPWSMMRCHPSQSACAGVEDLPRVVEETLNDGTVELRMTIPEKPSMGRNEIGLAVESTFPMENAVVLSLSLLEPERFSLRKEVVLEPGQEEEVSLPIHVRDAGLYKLLGNVRHVGATTFICEDTGEFRVVPFEEERKTLLFLKRRLKALERDVAEGMGRERIEPVLELLEEIEKTLQQTTDSYETLALSEKDAQIATWRRVEKEAQNLLFRLETAKSAQLHWGTIPQFGLSWTHNLVKVFPDIPFRGETKDEGVLVAARNEIEGGQLLVLPFFDALEQVSVSVGNLVGKGNKTISAESVTVYPVGYVQPGVPDREVPHLGLHPDPLLPQAPVDISEDRFSQSFWISVDVPEKAEAGEYQGTLQVKARPSGGDMVVKRTFPLRLKVWDFTLPEETALKTSVWIHEGHIAAFYGENPLSWETKKNYYDLHLRNRCGPIKSIGVPPTEEALRDLDYVMSHGQNCIFVHVPHWLDEEKRSAFREDLLKTKQILEERGWGNNVFFYSIDEVERQDYDKLKEMNAWVHEVVPKWPRLETQPVIPELVGSVDVWCPQVSDIDPLLWDERRQAGERLWTYCVWTPPSVMIDYPAVDHRVLFWSTWKYGAEGFLYWGSTYWTLNLRDPEGRRWPEIPWNTYTVQPGHNGCGQLIYPGPHGTALSSVRLEILRDGIEDYQYLAQTKELLERSDVSPEIKRRAQELIEVGPDVAIGPRDYSLDPEGILKHRAKLGELLDSL